MQTQIVLRIALVAALLAVATPVNSQNQAAADNPLNQLAWLTGGKWIAEGEKGPNGKPFRVESTITWGENGRTINFITRFLENGKLVPVYTGLYAWHPAKKKFVFIYTDNRGNLTEGQATMTADRLEQEFQIVGTEGMATPFRSTMVRQGPDDYDWSVLRQKEGKWEEIFGLKYKRSRD